MKSDGESSKNSQSSPEEAEDNRLYTSFCTGGVVKRNLQNRDESLEEELLLNADSFSGNRHLKDTRWETESYDTLEDSIEGTFWAVLKTHTDGSSGKGHPYTLPPINPLYGSTYVDTERKSPQTITWCTKLLGASPLSDNSSSLRSIILPRSALERFISHERLCR